MIDTIATQCRWPLTGKWWFRFDPDDRGCPECWHTVDLSAQRLAWRTIDVPSSWNHVFGDNSPDVSDRCIGGPEDYDGFED
ncbi:MAG: hypothetical protein MI725_00240, partial [Pirellulales bacterium]|nr:hypothetical protein [Pirellulales bacterium]